MSIPSSPPGLPVSHTGQVLSGSPMTSFLVVSTTETFCRPCVRYHRVGRVKKANRISWPVSSDDVNVEIDNVPFAQCQGAIDIIFELIASAQKEIAIVIGVGHCQ